MKTFKDIISEVAEPKGGDEKRFKAKHVTAKYDHPAAEEEQFTSDMKKDKTKKASYEKGKDAEVYEGYTSDAQRKAVHASKDEEKKKKKKSFKEMFSGQDLAEDPFEEVPMMMRQLEFICYAAEEIKEYAGMGVDPEEWFQNKLAHVHGQMQGLHAYIEGDKRMMSAKMSDMNPMGEEVEQIDEISKKTLGSYVKKASSDLYSRGSRTQYHSNKRNKSSGPFEKESKKKHQSLADYHYRKAGNRAAGIEKATDRLTKEEVELDEAFKMGSMKLKDGSNVKLSKEEAEAVNELFNELNSSNKKRMEEEMMKNKSGFDKVLKFAKEAM